MLRLPCGGVRQYANALQHYTDSKRVICGAWTGQGAVQGCVDENRIRLAGVRTVRNANNDVRKIAVAKRISEIVMIRKVDVPHVLYSRFPIMSKLYTRHKSQSLVAQSR